jgi:hypothetical protein
MQASPVEGALLALDRRLAGLEQVVGEVRDALGHQAVEKEWYSTGELAQALGVSVYTVTARWCHEGRIAAKKDPVTGKWRVPASEYRRLVAGGSLRPATR